MGYNQAGILVLDFRIPGWFCHSEEEKFSWPAVSWEDKQAADGFQVD